MKIFWFIVIMDNDFQNSFILPIFSLKIYVWWELGQNRFTGFLGSWHPKMDISNEISKSISFTSLYFFKYIMWESKTNRFSSLQFVGILNIFIGEKVFFNTYLLLIRYCTWMAYSEILYYTILITFFSVKSLYGFNKKYSKYSFWEPHWKLYSEN